MSQIQYICDNIFKDQQSWILVDFKCKHDMAMGIMYYFKENSALMYKTIVPEYITIHYLIHTGKCN